jgi:dienelactone hydrolase
MLTWPDDDFVCDCQYTTSFPPQPLANAGFVVAIFNIYDAFNTSGPSPSGPPQTKEAESTVASVKSLIDALDKKGIIDRGNVGIMGFSRSSWKVDYLLTHSDVNLRAASSADGGLGEYGALWMFDGGDVGQTLIKSYGGDFLGPAQSAWLDGAPAFNAEKVNVPLLMEYTGDKLRDEPLSAYELHSALIRLHKPVELFFYPDGDHPLDTPFERVASLQRNVDWFRFWMQGWEGRPPSYDPEQYTRWERLKTLRTDATADKNLQSGEEYGRLP